MVIVDSFQGIDCVIQEALHSKALRGMVLTHQHLFLCMIRPIESYEHNSQFTLGGEVGVSLSWATDR